MAVVKKTLAIHPIMDGYIRDTWSALIKGGYDASYSTTLNYMLLEHILSVAEEGINEKIAEQLRSFLEDEETIEELNLEEYATRVDELFSRRDRRKGGRDKNESP